MAKQPPLASSKAEDNLNPSGDAASGKDEWQEPKLRFVEPKLVERGPVKDLTGGFFGSFSP